MNGVYKASDFLFLFGCGQYPKEAYSAFSDATEKMKRKITKVFRSIRLGVKPSRYRNPTSKEQAEPCPLCSYWHSERDQRSSQVYMGNMAAAGCAALGEQFPFILGHSPVAWGHFQEGGQISWLAILGKNHRETAFWEWGKERFSKSCPGQAGNKLLFNVSSLIEPTSLAMQWRKFLCHPLF